MAHKTYSARRSWGTMTAVDFAAPQPGKFPELSACAGSEAKPKEQREITANRVFMN